MSYPNLMERSFSGRPSQFFAAYSCSCNWARMAWPLRSHAKLKAKMVIHSIQKRKFHLLRNAFQSAGAKNNWKPIRIILPRIVQPVTR